MMGKVWVVIGTEGEYSDYAAEILSVWTSSSEASHEKEKKTLEIAEHVRLVQKWSIERDMLWDKHDIGKARFWEFYNEEKRVQWLKIQPIFPEGPNYDRVGVVEIPVGITGQYWIDD